MTRTTVGELRDLLESYSDDTEIILRVRGNSTEDYSIDKTIAIQEKGDSGKRVVIQDFLSI